MFAIAFALLFALASAVAMISIADSMLKARSAYLQLMQEAALMQAGYVVQVDAQQLRVRRAGASRVVARLDRRQPRLQPGLVPVPATGGA